MCLGGGAQGFQKLTFHNTEGKLKNWNLNSVLLRRNYFNS